MTDSLEAKIDKLYKLNSELSWSDIWSFLATLTPAMLFCSVIFNLGAGLLTIYSVTYVPNIIESNTLLYPLIDNFGIESILFFNLGCIIIFSAFYKFTKFNKYYHVIMMTVITTMSFLNFLNDFTFAFGIEVLKPVFIARYNMNRINIIGMLKNIGGI